MSKVRFLLLAILALAACRNEGGKNAGDSKASATAAPGTKAKASEFRHFPTIEAPKIYDDNSNSAAEYTLEHFWDAFFSVPGPTDSARVLGVPNAEFEQALANWLGISLTFKNTARPDSIAPLQFIQKCAARFFSQIETAQKADSASALFPRITEAVARYMYDPNSPLRDEDIYLPFVEKLAESAFTSHDMRTAYRYEASRCRINRFGQKVPDFGYKTAGGDKGTLYGVKAEYTMLFFSNPGCESCKSIIDEIRLSQGVSALIADRRLAVVNIYIDEEVAEWRKYCHNYPSTWINGYDYTFSLRDGGGYDIRAIPSLYLLDSDKRVIMKDAPTQRVISYLESKTR